MLGVPEHGRWHLESSPKGMVAKFRRILRLQLSCQNMAFAGTGLLASGGSAFGTDQLKMAQGYALPSEPYCAAVALDPGMNR